MRTQNAQDAARDAGGKFGTGNQYGRLPRRKRDLKRQDRLSKAVADTVSAQDLREVVRALIERAKAGNVSAAREVLARSLGKVGAEAGSAAADQMKEEVRDGEWFAQVVNRLHRERMRNGS